MTRHQFHRLSAGNISAFVTALLLLATPLHSAEAQSTTNTAVGKPAAKLTAAQLQADFVVFKHACQDMHPGLYRYNTRRQMDANFRQLQSQLNHDLSLSGAYIAFAQFLAKIECGHSYPNFFNQPKSTAEALLQNPDRVPFLFRWLGRRMIVTRNLSKDPRLVPGTEVLAINGTPAGKILDTLMTVSRADGSNEAKRRENLEIHGTSRYEAFDIYFPMFFPVREKALSLKVKPPQQGKLDLQVEALTYDQRLAPYKAQIEALRGDKPVWELQFLDDRTACLRMPSWAVFNSKWDWQGFLDLAFEQMAQKNVRTLVIDLRGNEGGSDIGNAILSKLIKTDLHAAGQLLRWVRYRKAPKDLKPYLDTWDWSFLDWGDYARDLKDGFSRMTKFDDDAAGDVIKASPHPFAGKTFVIVDASNSSATFQFDKTVKQNHLATLVGQTTGGNQRGINGGAFFFLNLPNSKIETDLPLVGFFPPGFRPALGKSFQMSVPDAGIDPDIFVKPAIEDIQHGVDSEMKAVLQLASAGTDQEK